MVMSDEIKPSAAGSMVSVPRELIGNAIDCMEGSASARVVMWREKLIDAIENAPAEDVRAMADEPVAWANDQQLLLCGKSPRMVEPNNSMLHSLPRNIAGSALPTEYCNTPLYRHAQRKTAMPEREALRDIIAQVIVGDAYDCIRVWSVWGVGTMSDDDFVPIVHQEERLNEITDACLDEFKRLNGDQS